MPEVERRQARGTTPPELIAAQIVFHMEHGVTVRLNEEVKARARVRLNRDVTPGEPIQIADINEMIGLALTDEDADAAHITLARTGPDEWTIAFNAHYNRSKANATITAAREYLHLAVFAHQEGLLRGFADTLYSAVELAAKAGLLLIPNPRTLAAKSHAYVVTHFNLVGGKLGSAPRAHVALLNTLSKLRTSAKYAVEPFALNAEIRTEMLRDAEGMIATVAARINVGQLA